MTSKSARRASLALAILAILVVCGRARAARPMVVDDASLASPGTCQLEAWTQRAEDRAESWLMPACNVAGDWELGVGLGRIRSEDGGASRRSAVLQAKTVFRTLDPNDWGIGLTMASQFHQGAHVDADLSVLVPVSVSLLDDRVLVHANAGWLRAHDSGRQDGFWATGAEWAAQPKLTLTLETYGTGRGHGYVQAGARWNLAGDRLALDAGLGSRIGRSGRFGAERYATIGLTLVTAAR